MNEIKAIIIFICLFWTGCVYWNFLRPESSKKESLLIGGISVITFIIMGEFGIFAYFFITNEPVRNEIMMVLPIVEIMTSIFEDPWNFITKGANEYVCFTILTIYLFFEFAPQGHDIIKKIKTYIFYQGIYWSCKVFKIAITLMFVLSCIYNQKMALYLPHYLTMMAFLSVVNE